MAQADHLQPSGELHRRLLLRPVHHAGISERALIEGPNRRDRRAEVGLYRLEGPWQVPPQIRLLCCIKSSRVDVLS